MTARPFTIVVVTVALANTAFRSDSVHVDRVATMVPPRTGPLPAAFVAGHTISTDKGPGTAGE